MAPPTRSEIRISARVRGSEKQHQRTRLVTEGIVAGILVNSASHRPDIKAMFEDGRAGRVQAAVANGG